MNTYNMTKDYYNYANNNYNQPLYDQNIQDKQIYDPYNGFIRGNMFPELYNSYKLNKPLEITPMNEQAELLTYVDALTFAMIDLNLYLDVYPNDSSMLTLFNDYRSRANKLAEEYENKYGPLNISNASSNELPFSWENTTWPWEGDINV